MEILEECLKFLESEGKKLARKGNLKHNFFKPNISIIHINALSVSLRHPVCVFIIVAGDQVTSLQCLSDIHYCHLLFVLSILCDFSSVYVLW